MTLRNKDNRRSAFFITVAVFAGHVLWWLLPGDTAYLIFQNREVLLGRYSVDRFSAMVSALILTLPFLYVLWAGDAGARKERLFKTLAISMGIMIGLVLVDGASRIGRTARYVQTKDVYHRVPDQTITGVFRDEPVTRARLSHWPAGHDDVAYTLTVDKRGFRNRMDLPAYDVLVLGDSFAEGSSVSDDQAWPEIVRVENGISLYNLGMSGGNPGSYVEALTAIGDALSPRLILCMIYEGNDFRGTGDLETREKKQSSVQARMGAYVKNSPVRDAVKRQFINAFAVPVDAATLESGNGNDFSWMPLSIPEGDEPRHYFFTVKRLLEHYITDPATFETSKGCRTVFEAIEALKTHCEAAGKTLLVIYAPDKPHVLMPLVQDRVGSRQIRDFLALRADALPAPEAVKAQLFDRIDNRERAVRRFCSHRSIHFFSLTAPLRQAARQGEQVYYTYDQHWTPDGHRTVAAEITGYLQSNNLIPSN